MPFGLIKAGAKYQRMVNKLLVDMIEDTVEAYIDNMLVKSKLGVDHQRDLERPFARMKLHNVRLNPSKGAFCVNLRKFPASWWAKGGLKST